MVFFVSTKFIYASPPNWEDAEFGTFATSAVITGIVLNDDLQLGDVGDILGAFDEAGDIRGFKSAEFVAFPPSPYNGTVLYEMSVWGDDGDLISFKYYDASEDIILDISSSYEFLQNEFLGSVFEPYELSLDSGLENEPNWEDADFGSFSTSSVVTGIVLNDGDLANFDAILVSRMLLVSVFK